MSMVRYRYGHPNGYAEFLSFLSSVPNAEFAKVTRSTVPLLAWWADSRRVEKLRNLLHFGDRLEECFEYPVAASCPKCTVKGKGKSSFTDVIMQTVAETVAIEAKYTEKLYPTIKRWAGSPVEENKQLVLDHWMKCCIGTSQKWDDYKDLVYQMVHRTASACVQAAERKTAPHVVLLLFVRHDSASKHVDTYVNATGQLSKVLDRREPIGFHVVRVETKEGEWLERVKRESAEQRADALRDAIGSQRPLFTFEDPVLVYPKP